MNNRAEGANLFAFVQQRIDQFHRAVDAEAKAGGLGAGNRLRLRMHFSSPSLEKLGKTWGKIEIGKLIVSLIGIILATFGSKLIYNSRIITKKFFSFGDQNDGTFIVKIVGFTSLVIGGIIILFN